jgi:iron-sulfur cluster repair protein YtfE (RIC family)
MSAGSGDEVVERLWGQRPMLLPVLLHAGVDPDAAAGHTLGALCLDRGLVLEELLRELTAAEAPLTSPWHGASVGALVDHVLVAYHAPWPALLEAARAAHGSHHDDATRGADAGRWGEVDQLLADLGADMASHMAKEERVLFPWLRVRAATAAAPIRAMLLEHGDTLRLLARLHGRLARRVAEPDALDVLTRALCAHVHVENTLLFPRALDSGAR